VSVPHSSGRKIGVPHFFLATGSQATSDRWRASLATGHVPPNVGPVSPDDLVMKLILKLEVTGERLCHETPRYTIPWWD